MKHTRCYEDMKNALTVETRLKDEDTTHIIQELSLVWWSSAFSLVALQFGAGSKSTWSMKRFDFVLFSMQASKNVFSCN